VCVCACVRERECVGGGLPFSYIKLTTFRFFFKQRTWDKRPTSPSHTFPHHLHTYIHTPQPLFLTTLPLPDSMMSKADEEIYRLTGTPNCAAQNLNPYLVLQVEDPENVTFNELRRIYRKLSLLVHPDRNSSNARAPDAFDVLNKAYRQLTEGEERETCDRVLDEAVRRVNQDFAQRRKALRDEGKVTPGEQEEAALKKQALKLMLTRLFGEYAARKQRLIDLDAANRKREREQEQQEQEQRRGRRDFAQRWEVTRDSRVDAWRAFSRTAKASLREVDAEQTAAFPQHAAMADDQHAPPPLPARVSSHLQQRSSNSDGGSGGTNTNQATHPHHDQLQPQPQPHAHAHLTHHQHPYHRNAQSAQLQYVGGVAPGIQKPAHGQRTTGKKQKKGERGEGRRPKTTYFRGVRRPPRLKVQQRRELPKIMQ
jgi:DnaJ homolog subfamily C member 8